LAGDGRGGDVRQNKNNMLGVKTSRDERTLYLHLVRPSYFLSCLFREAHRIFQQIDDATRLSRHRHWLKDIAFCYGRKKNKRYVTATNFEQALFLRLFIWNTINVYRSIFIHCWLQERFFYVSGNIYLRRDFVNWSRNKNPFFLFLYAENSLV